jgi:hypothetical protein
MMGAWLRLLDAFNLRRPRPNDSVARLAETERLVDANRQEREAAVRTGNLLLDQLSGIRSLPTAPPSRRRLR